MYDILSLSLSLFVCMASLVSAPGKVLISGGYLVLDPTQSGLVLAVDARIYCKITRGVPTDFPMFAHIERAAVKYHVVFSNPQFLNARPRKCLFVSRQNISLSRSVLDHFDVYERYVVPLC